MDDSEIEAQRLQKMKALREAREAYRSLASSTDPLTSRQVPRLLSDQLRIRQDAVKTAESELRTFNQDHPRRVE
jgi:hypothetical protein